MTIESDVIDIMMTIMTAGNAVTDVAQKGTDTDRTATMTETVVVVGTIVIIVEANHRRRRRDGTTANRHAAEVDHRRTSHPANINAENRIGTRAQDRWKRNPHILRRKRRMLKYCGPVAVAVKARLKHPTTIITTTTTMPIGKTVTLNRSVRRM